MKEKELEELKDEVLFLLFKDAELPIKKDLTNAEKNNFLRALFLTRAEDSVEEKLLNAQNKLLKEQNKLSLTKISSLTFKNNVAHTNNILNLDCDMAVIVTDNLLENINALTLDDVDNVLILKAGLEFKANLIKELKANNNKINYNEPYIMDGYCLNSKTISKIIFNKKYFNLINFNVKNTKKDENYNYFLNILKNNLDLLFNYIISNELKTVAFHFNFNSLKSAGQNLKINSTIENLKLDLIDYIISKNKKLKLKLIFNV